MPVPVPGQKVDVRGWRNAHEFLSEMMLRCPDDRTCADWREIGREVGLSVAGARMVACIGLLKCWNYMVERGIRAEDLLPSDVAHHTWRRTWS